MRGRLAAWVGVAGGVGFGGRPAVGATAGGARWGARGGGRTSAIRGWDEGVYWQAIRAHARNEPLFKSVFASQPPMFYETLLPFYWVGHSLTSLRIGVLMLGLVGLAATYVTGRLLVGHVVGLVAVLLAATSPLYLHQSAIVQAD